MPLTHSSCIYRMAFESERKRILLSKLMGRYVENLEVQSIEVEAFKSGLSVQSFKTEKLPAELQKDLETVREVLNAEAEARERAQKAPEQEAQRVAEEAAEAFASGDFEKAKKLRQEKQEKADEGGTGGGDATGTDNNVEDEDDVDDAAGHRADARKKMRAKRKAKMQALEKRKPAVNDVDPNDVAVIKWVERNVGDYKLKTAKDYVVPESMRINAEKKRQQLIVLKEKIYEIEMEHNEKFLELRDNKRQIIDEVSNYNKRLREIAAELGEDPPELWEPQINQEEFPEDVDKVSSEEVVSLIRENGGLQGEEVNVEQDGVDIDDETLVVSDDVSIEDEGTFTDAEAQEIALEQAEVNICPILRFRKTQTIGMKSELEKRFAKIEEIKLYVPPRMYGPMKKM